MSSIVYEEGVNNLEVLGKDMKIVMLWFDSYDAIATKNARELLPFLYDHPSWVWVRRSYKQPWAWQTKLPVKTMGLVTLVVWPHKAKWMVEGFKAEEGWDNLRKNLPSRLAALDKP